MDCTGFLAGARKNALSSGGTGSIPVAVVSRGGSIVLSSAAAVFNSAAVNVLVPTRALLIRSQSIGRASTIDFSARRSQR